MGLAEQGKLALDTPVAQWLPDFAAGGKEDVTLRHLLTHTSGLPDYLQLWKLEATPAARMQRVLTTPLLVPPGTVFRYSDLGLIALGLVLVPVHGEPGRPRRALRWTSLAIALPVLTLITTSTVWIVSLARPDAQHAHAGALLQSTNEIATPQQAAAATQLYAETKAAILPFQDWHQAWAAGFRPGGGANLGSTHWMNQKYVDAGYVMDPHRPQGLVYANTKHGPVLLGAMFQMKHIGQFGPDPGGPLTAWHQHENICVTPIFFEFSLMTPFATCPLGAIDISVSPMLHVWIVDNPKGGQFAVDIDPQVVRSIDRL